MMIPLERAGDPCGCITAFPSRVYAQLMKRCRLAILTNNEAVVVQLDPGSAKPVEIAGSRQAIDLQLEPDNE